MMLTLLIIVVLVIAIFQLAYYSSTKRMIKSLQSFFPDVKRLALLPFKISETDSNAKLDENVKRATLQNLYSQDGSDDSDLTSSLYVNIITAPDSVKNDHGDFFDVLVSTNNYLCKNRGAAADLSLLQEPCEKKIETIEDEIDNTLNTPLYCGLGGTFIGIIFGLVGLLANAHASGAGKTIEFADIQDLLIGVAVAMCASFLGLLLSVLNSTVHYKKASAKVSADRQEYYDFLRQELMPVLTSSMASSLNSLKGVLGHFVDKFGRNLDAYSDSADLLNDNLEKQHLVLQEINQLGMSQTAAQIASSFKTLKESSDALGVFKGYQDTLNATIQNLGSTTSRIESIISSFNEFTAALGIVARNQVESNAIQQRFAEAIQTHFPTGSEGREAWRKEFDTLISDAQAASTELHHQLAESSRYIRNFTENNSEFYASLNQLQPAISSLVQYAEAQARCYNELAGEIRDLRRDCKSGEEEAIKTRQDIVNAVAEMTHTLKSLKIVRTEIIDEARREARKAVQEEIAKNKQDKKQ